MLPTRVLAGAGILLAGLGAGLVLFSPGPAQAQGADPCLGQLMLFGGNFCPRGWIDANGQIMSIAQNTALFSIYGTMYGGNGQTTFGLPDLRGRAPISLGQGAGLPNYSQGEVTGSVSTTLSASNLPAHSHRVNAASGDGLQSEPGNSLLAGGQPIYLGGPAADSQMAPNMIAPTGDGQPVAILNPVLVIRWCVALEGIFCARN